MIRANYSGTHLQNAHIFSLMRLFFLSISLLFPPSSPADNEAKQTVPVIKWIEHQSSVKSVEASFVQERHLKALKRPLINKGKLWFKSPGLFRWQIGTPLESIAFNRTGELLLLRPQKKTGELVPRTSVATRGSNSGMLFFDLGFPRNHEEFAKKFTVTGVMLENESYFITVKVNDIRTSLALRKIVFQVNSSNFSTQAIVLRFRDSSSVSTRFSKVRENVKLEDSLFEFDLTGYKIKSSE